MSTTTAAGGIHSDLPLVRLHSIRAGYLLMAVGLAAVKWPLLSNAATLPLYEGVTLCRPAAPAGGQHRLLTACPSWHSSVCAIRSSSCPVLLFESAWKLAWLARVRRE